MTRDGAPPLTATGIRPGRRPPRPGESLAESSTLPRTGNQASRRTKNRFARFFRPSRPPSGNPLLPPHPDRPLDSLAGGGTKPRGGRQTWGSDGRNLEIPADRGPAGGGART